jgi:predicted DCC family thiol-disulfide oxidoreductase YuxK
VASALLAPATPVTIPWRLVYDHECSVCRVIAAAVVIADRRGLLVPLALGDGRTAQALATLPPASWGRSGHLIAPDGRVWSAGAAVPMLCRLLPGFGGLGRLCSAAPDMTERVYAWLVRHRSRIGRRLPRRLVARATVILAERCERI